MMSGSAYGDRIDLTAEVIPLVPPRCRTLSGLPQSVFVRRPRQPAEHTLQVAPSPSPARVGGVHLHHTFQ